MTWLLQIGHTRRLLNTLMYLSMLFGRHRLLSEKKESFLPNTKRGRTILSKIQQSVKLFYEGNEYSRLMSGVKDYMNVGSKVHKQKHLLLCNLREIHVTYKQKCLHHKTGLSNFSELRLKWCVTVSSSGAHSVGVCTMHQNATLLVATLNSIINKYLKWRKKEKEEEEIHNATDTVTETEKYTLINMHKIAWFQWKLSLCYWRWNLRIPLE